MKVAGVLLAGVVRLAEGQGAAPGKEPSFRLSDQRIEYD